MSWFSFCSLIVMILAFVAISVSLAYHILNADKQPLAFSTLGSDIRDCRNLKLKEWERILDEPGIAVPVEGVVFAQKTAPEKKSGEPAKIYYGINIGYGIKDIALFHRSFVFKVEELDESRDAAELRKARAHLVSGLRKVLVKAISTKNYEQFSIYDPLISPDALPLILPVAPDSE